MRNLNAVWNLNAMRRAAVLAAAGLVGLAPFGGCNKSGGGNASGGGDKIKIGFLVKQPEEPWFQTEIKFAKKAAADHGFELVDQGVENGEKALTAIDNLAAQGVKGFVICTPDTKLGPAIKSKADADDLKFMTVDDQLIKDDKPMDNVPHLGMSSHDIGHQEGEEDLKEMKNRGWKVEDTGVVVSSFVTLQTARERTDGAQEALRDGGFPQSKLYDAPNKTTDVAGSRDATTAILTQHPDVKHWIVVGMNDNAVIGAVRGTEAANISPDDVIGIGINGTEAVGEFQRPSKTGFFGSLLLSPNDHGYKTAEMVYEWVKNGTQPPPATIIRKATLITRDNYKQVLKDKGLD